MLVLINNWRGLLLGFVRGAEKGNAGGECTRKASKRLLGTDVRCVVDDKGRGRGGGEGRDLFSSWGCAGYEWCGDIYLFMVRKFPLARAS